MPNPSELIDDMIVKTPDWRGTTLAELRRVIRDADPEIPQEPVSQVPRGQSTYPLSPEAHQCRVTRVRWRQTSGNVSETIPAGHPATPRSRSPGTADAATLANARQLGEARAFGGSSGVRATCESLTLTAPPQALVSLVRFQPGAPLLSSSGHVPVAQLGPPAEDPDFLPPSALDESLGCGPRKS